MPETVIVTGGAGYVGSHVCKLLARRGYRPVVVDDLRRGHAAAVRWGPLEAVALERAAAVRALMRRHRPLAVMHFAAYVAAGESAREPSSYYRNNLGALLSVIDAMRAAAVEHIVFSSTAAIYGTSQAMTIAEDHPCAPVSPYGSSKLMCERVLTDAETAYGIRSVRLRYFNAAGADPEGEIGESHDPETHLIPLAIRAALDPASPLTVFGTDYPTPDGTCIRDYVHVEDLATAHIAALDHLRRGGASDAFNLGTGTGHSVREVVRVVSSVLERPVALRRAERRPGDPGRLVADPRRAMRVLGWRPQSSDLDTIIRTAAAWMRGSGTRGLPGDEIGDVP